MSALVERGAGWTMCLGDAFELVGGLVGVDAVITDPPYGMRLDARYRNSKANPKKHVKASRGYQNVEGDHVDFDPAPLLASLGGVGEQLWFGADYYRSRLPDGGSWFVWDKRVGLEGVVYSSAEFELCWSRRAHHRKLLRHRWFGLCGTETQDIRERIHPTQKPVELMLECVSLVTKPGETVLDAFAGSGTTGVACLRLGRRFIGIEKDPKYFALACDRLRAEERGSTLQAQRAGQLPLLGGVK